MENGTRILLTLLCIAAGARAGPTAPDAPTRHLPENAVAVFRLPPPDRIDALADGTAEFWALFEQPRPRFARMLPRAYRSLPIARNRPFYVAVLSPVDTAMLLPLKEGAAPPEKVGERHARVVDGWLLVARKSVLDAPSRGKAFRMLPGDAAVVVDVASIVERNAGQLAEAVKRIEELDPAELPVPVPAAAVKLWRGLFSLVLKAVRGTHSVHYALTEKEGRLFSEGFVRTRPETEFRALLSSCGEPEPHLLAGFLPEGAFLTVDTHGPGSMLDVKAAAWLDATLGEGAGEDLLLLLSPSHALARHLTGRGAGTIHSHGPMAMVMRSVWEAKPDAPLDRAIRALDADAINRRFAAYGLPVTVRIDRDVDKVGETALHNVRFLSNMPELAPLLTQMSTWFCVEGKYLLTVQSTNGRHDLRDFVERVREGKPGDHPHFASMKALGLARHEGLTIDFGALKPALAMLGMFVPEAGRAIQHLPDSIPSPTALRVVDGNIHLRGSWPLPELLEFAKNLR